MTRVTAPMPDGRSQTSPPLPDMKAVSPAAVTNGRTKPWSLSGHPTLHAYVTPPSLSRQRTLMPQAGRFLRPASRKAICWFWADWWLDALF
jgi:hypothetical protein